MRSRKSSLKTADALLTYLRREEKTTAEMRPKAQKREAAAWGMMKDALKRAGWIATRLETWALPGVPDVLLADPQGRLALVELKVTLTRRINLSPHQAAFLSTYGRRGAPVWILVRQGVGKDCVWFLFPGAEATRLALYAFAEEDPAAAGIWRGAQPDWADLFACLVGGSSVSNLDRLEPRADRRKDETEDETRATIEAAERLLRRRELRAEAAPVYNATLPGPRSENRWTRGRRP